MKHLIFGAALTVVAPLSATAQFLPAVGTDAPRICPDQPARPDWIENIAPREAHKGQLVQMMYRAQGMQAVAESGSCGCDTRFPTWESSQEYYYEHYSALERYDTQQRTAEYRRTANDFSKIARPICELENNW